MDPLQALLCEIAEEARATADTTGRPVLAARVLRAIEAVPRHLFVPPTDERLAYANSALPIGQGQTISQPFIVALMTDLLELRPEHVVLEIGTGSGYQAAVLAQLVRQVYSVEVIAALAAASAARLRELGIYNVEIRVGDGRQGWPEHAPYDGIIVTAAAAEVPPALLGQLRPSGRLVIPLGDEPRFQDLALIEKAADGSLRQRSVLPVAFVPLVRRSDAADQPVLD
jgi:protein-L-isoaspartate(D-aspartate) O-methyltransferase